MLLVGLFACLTVQAAQTDRMDLSGLWRFQLDPMGFGKTPRIGIVFEQTDGNNRVARFYG